MSTSPRLESPTLGPIPAAAAPALTAPSSVARRLTHIDGLRGICAVGVVIHHICLTVWLTSVTPLPPRGLIKWTLALSFGDERVIMFTVLSGFCLMIPVARGDGTLRGGIPLFFRRRARRLLPPYYLALAITLILGYTILARPVGSLWDAALPLRWTDVLLHLVMLHNVNEHAYRINYVLWSIAVEWQIYAIFPAFVWATRHIGILGAALLTAAAGVALQTLLAHCGLANTKWEYLAYFSAGALAAWLTYRPRNPTRDSIAAALLSLAAAIAFLCLRHPRPLLAQPLAAVAFAALLVTLGLRPHLWLARITSWRPFVLIGLSSYSLYMLHPLVIELCQRFLLPPSNALSANQQFLLLSLLSLPLSLLAAALFFYAVERRFMTAPLVPQPQRIDRLLQQTAAQRPPVPA